MPFILDDGLRNGLLQYLGQRPWQEVQQAMQALATLPEHKQEQKDDAAGA